MLADTSMDRIICGDVGFGKTEIALRASFLAVKSGYSALWIAPTTLLVEQHAETIKQRFAKFSIPVFQLSRIAQNSITMKLRSQLKNTAPAIIVGTHRLLQKRLAVKNPSLLVIDEEHKFGVEHKNALLQHYPTIDLLTMSATPIPRTLHYGMTGLKDFSLIASPPPSRKPARTYCMAFNPEFTREAIVRERQRGGQVFIVVKTIGEIPYWHDKIQALVPNETLEIAHGRMKSDELESIIFRFSHKEFSILLSTTIIESGIDIPNANTLIVIKANYFSPIQLHQLRGRVGRSHQQAIAVFISDSKKGVEKLQELKDTFLGAGFQLSLNDLERRGAGDLLGKKQSGNFHTIGTELYLDLLANAMEDLSSARKPLEQEVAISFFEPGFIPETYCPHPSIRLSYYRQLSRAKTHKAIDLILHDITDKYHEAPLQLDCLIAITKMKIIASEHFILSLHWQRKKLTLELDSQHQFSAARLIAHATKESNKTNITFHTDGTISISHQPLGTPKDHLLFLKQIIKDFATDHATSQ